jgi:hypothetical protein
MSVASSAGQDFHLTRADLNRPIGNTGLFLDVKISPMLPEKFVTFTFLENERIQRTEPRLHEQLKRQKIPSLVSWIIGDSTRHPEFKWACAVISNRDGTIHTIAQIPDSQWKRSYLLFEFPTKSLSSRNSKHVRVFLSLKDFDFENTAEYQGVDP